MIQKTLQEIPVDVMNKIMLQELTAEMFFKLMEGIKKNDELDYWYYTAGKYEITIEKLLFLKYSVAVYANEELQEKKFHCDDFLIALEKAKIKREEYKSKI